MPKRTDISSILVIGAISLTVLGACSGIGADSKAAQQEDVIDFTDGFQQSDADAILGVCGASDVTLTVKADGEIYFEPDLDADYESSACVLNKIKESGTTKFGFVGSEKYATPDESE